MRKKGDDNGRDHRGRFAKGNKLGKGNPHLVALGKFRDAINSVGSAEDAAAVMREFLAIAKGEPRPTDDDPNPAPPSYTERIAAGRAYLERVAGKPQDPPVTIPEGLFDFELTDARASLAAAQQVAEAAGRGEIDLGTAKALGELLDIRDRLELAVIVERLEAVEAK